MGDNGKFIYFIVTMFNMFEFLLPYDRHKSNIGVYLIPFWLIIAEASKHRVAAEPYDGRPTHWHCNCSWPQGA